MAEDLEKQEKKSVEIINIRFLKPLDENIIKTSIEKTKNVITIEDGTKINGLATAVKELIIDNNLFKYKLKKSYVVTLYFIMLYNKVISDNA